MWVHEYSIKKKKHYLRCKDKTKKIIWCIKIYTITYTKIPIKNEDLQSIMSNLQPNSCLKSISKKWTNMQEAGD